MLIKTHNSKIFKDIELLDRCLAVEVFRSPRRSPRPTPRRLKERLTDSDRQSLVETYRAGGITMRQLAEDYKIADYSVRLILRQAGEASPYSRTSPEQTLRARKLWVEGNSIKAIAQAVGMSETKVRLVVADLRKKS